MQKKKLKGFRLSLQQARLWTVQGESQAFHVGGVAQLDGSLDIQVLFQALQRMLDRHAIFRTTFQAVASLDKPLQIITDDVTLVCPYIDLSRITPGEQDKLIQECYSLWQTRHVIFTQQSLMCVTLWRLSPRTHYLFLDFPALCADTVTLRLWMEELSKLYTAAMHGEAPDEGPLQYVEVAAWQEELLKNADDEELRAWAKFDLSRLAAQRLPLEEGQRASNPSASFAPWSCPVALPAALCQQLLDLAGNQAVSLEVCLLACWQGLLWCLLDEPEFLLGVLCHGRINEELEAAPGLYARCLPLRVVFDDTLSFEHALHLVHASLTEALEEQAYFRWESVQTAEHETCVPIFPLCFEYTSFPRFFATTSGLRIVPEKFYGCTEPYALKLSAWQRGNNVEISLWYDQRRIERPQGERLAQLFLTFMQGVVAQPARALLRTPLLTSAEQRDVAHLLRGPDVPLPALPFHQLFEEQAACNSEQMAVIGSDMQMTYRELNGRANQLARILRRYNVGPNVPVGLCMTRSAQMILGMLAILKAGGVYVPLDKESPSSRLLYQLQDTQAPLLLTQRQLNPLIARWNGQVLNLEDLDARLHLEVQDDLPAQTCLSDLIYIMYTSGSTGAPKGVPILQQSVVNYAQAMCRLLHAEVGWNYATVSTLAADLGNTAILCALASGGCLHVLDYETVISADRFARWFAVYPIDVLKITPSHFSALLKNENAERMIPRRALIFGGEALSAHLVGHIQSLGGTCRIYNHYGPTETTVGVLVNELPPEAAPERVPLGRPLANTEVYVLNRGQQMVPPGMVGDLYIGGLALAPGYLHQAEQSALRFVPHLFGEQAGVRLYRSGDLVHYTSQGVLEFIGRSDTQVKLRGYRIELGEIEAVIRQMKEVLDVAVLLREDTPGEQLLVAYVVARHRSRLTSEVFSSYVQERVPAYMVPSVFVDLDALPLTKNGKVDRERLPAPELQQGKGHTFSRRPSSPIEEILQEIWCDLLGVPAIDRDENFFQLGGHSLLATQMIARACKVLQVDLSILELFERPTIRQLAACAEQALHGGAGYTRPELVSVRRDRSSFPLSFAQQRFWLLDRLEPGNTSYLTPRVRTLSGGINYRLVEQSLKALLLRHEVLRTVFCEEAGQPVQVIQPETPCSLLFIDLMCLGPDERSLSAKRLVREETHQPCDLVHGPLVRCRLVKLAQEEHLLLLTMHHIITDGWSNDIFFREVNQVYQALALNQPFPLAPLPIQYADYAVWQRQWLQGEILERQMNYWRRQLEDAPVLVLPTDYPRPARRTFRGSTLSTRLPGSLRETLVAFCKREGVTLFMVLLAVFNILLKYYSGQNDISVGTPVANRNHPDLEGLIGLFINTLVLRTHLPEGATFREIMHRVREICIDAYTHQDLPFDLLVETLQPQRHPDYSPFFQVMFMLEHRPGMSAPAQDTGKIVALEYEMAKFDLTLGVIDTSTDLLVKIEYSTDLFSKATIEQMLSEYQQLILQAVDAPAQSLRLSLQTQEQADLLRYFNEDLEE